MPDRRHSDNKVFQKSVSRRVQTHVNIGSLDRHVVPAECFLGRIHRIQANCSGRKCLMMLNLIDLGLGHGFDRRQLIIFNFHLFSPHAERPLLYFLYFPPNPEIQWNEGNKENLKMDAQHAEEIEGNRKCQLWFRPDLSDSKHRQNIGESGDLTNS